MLTQLAPVTWLASYPRSGNTLLRIILNHCFGQFSQSIYDDHEFSDPVVSGLVGNEPVGRDPLAFINRAARADRKLFVKTHEAPGGDAHPAIYIVRDGRAAAVSHAHFLREVIGIKAELRDVITGKFSMSWSEHVKTWALSGRPNTLVVRFEDLAAAQPKTLQAIAAFIGRPLSREFDVSFARLHARSPAFFRRGSDRENIAEMNREDLDLFQSLHGEVLRQMGYGA